MLDSVSLFTNSAYADLTVSSAGSSRRSPSTGQGTEPSATRVPQDTVKLSTTSQVLSMRQNGASVDQIVASLGLKASEVDTDLGITSNSASTEASILAALSAKH